MSDSEPDYDMVRSETWDFPVDPLVGRGDSYKELQSCFLNPRDFPGRFPASKCVLLFGVPGTGKTAVLRKICQEMNLSLLSMDTAELFNKYLGDSEKMVREYFAKAEILAKTNQSVIFIDEIDAICMGRGNETEGGAGAARRVNTCLFNKIQDVSSNLCVVGATNFPASLDKAVLSRVNKYIHVPLPDENERKVFISAQMEFSGVFNNFTDEDWLKIQSDTKNFSYRDLQRLWFKLAELTYPPLRHAHFKKSDEEFVKFTPCWCSNSWATYRFDDIPIDTINIRVRYTYMVRALASVSTTVTKYEFPISYRIRFTTRRSF